MVTDRSYMLLLVTYGINVGVFYAMSTLLNQVVLFHFPVSAGPFISEASEISRVGSSAVLLISIRAGSSPSGIDSYLHPAV